MKSNKKNQFFTVLKILVTVVLLYFVFAKIPFQKSYEIIRNANPALMMVAFICLFMSQWVSAERLLSVLRSVQFSISRKTNNILYLIGMFYNFFIPGGIGGDMYKVYFLNKHYKWPVKQLSAALLWDRLMGLTAIGVLMVVFFGFIPFAGIGIRIWAVPALILVGVPVSYYVTKRMFPSYLKAYRPVFLQSLLVQLLQCLCVVFIAMGFSDTGDYINYILVFLLSSVLSVFSFSGVGVREMVFYKLSEWMVYDTVVAVTIALLFSVMTAFISLFGIVFHLMPDPYGVQDVK